MAAPLLQYCNSAILQFCNTAILQYCNSAILKFCNTAILQYCNSAILQYCNTEILKYCNTAMLQYWKSAILQYCTVLYIKVENCSARKGSSPHCLLGHCAGLCSGTSLLENWPPSIVYCYTRTCYASYTFCVLEHHYWRNDLPV